MINQPTPSGTSSDELKDKITELLDNEANHILYRGNAGSAGASCEGIIPPVIDEIVQLAEAYAEHLASRRALEARIDEIGNVQLDYGHQQAMTFVDGKSVPVSERYTKLQSMLNQEES